MITKLKTNRKRNFIYQQINNADSIDYSNSQERPKRNTEEQEAGLAEACRYHITEIEDIIASYKNNKEYQPIVEKTQKQLESVKQQMLIANQPLETLKKNLLRIKSIIAAFKQEQLEKIKEGAISDVKEKHTLEQKKLEEKRTELKSKYKNFEQVQRYLAEEVGRLKIKINLDFNKELEKIQTTYVAKINEKKTGVEVNNVIKTETQALVEKFDGLIAEIEKKAEEEMIQELAQKPQLLLTQIKTIKDQTKKPEIPEEITKRLKALQELKVDPQLSLEEKQKIFFHRELEITTLIGSLANHQATLNIYDRKMATLQTLESRCKALTEIKEPLLINRKVSEVADIKAELDSLNTDFKKEKEAHYQQLATTIIERNKTDDEKNWPNNDQSQELKTVTDLNRQTSYNINSGTYIHFGPEDKEKSGLYNSYVKAGTKLTIDSDKIININGKEYVKVKTDDNNTGWIDLRFINGPRAKKPEKSEA